MSETARVVNIDGKDYKEDDLSDSQKYLINQVQDLNAQEQQLVFKLEQIKTAKDVFFDRLKQTLTEEKNNDE